MCSVKLKLSVPSRSLSPSVSVLVRSWVVCCVERRHCFRIDLLHFVWSVFCVLDSPFIAFSVVFCHFDPLPV